MKAFRTISSLALALLVLVSSTNFMVGMHLCMGEVRDVALFSKAEACEMELKIPPCHRHTTAPCCEDQSILHDADDLKGSTASYVTTGVLPLQAELTSIVISEVVPSAERVLSDFNRYHPPHPSGDLTVAFRVFRI